ncbi:hypothetical protein CRE_28318 [Caenorhabditis remanei]|uniref:RING-type domain-containing protein n=1 Tax=Caenorhabditis remanei TaxID=31234 RepID=E3LLT7_CAERE|nr:hypothetical protein CRE_28318 [Caenorhabditis remanei]
MTDFESNGFNNLRSAASSDNLSLKNWAFPTGEKSKKPSESTSDTSRINSSFSDHLSISKWKNPLKELEESSKSSFSDSSTSTSSGRSRVQSGMKQMNEIDSDGYRIHADVSTDHLSLRNWGRPVESESAESSGSSGCASSGSSSSGSSSSGSTSSGTRDLPSRSSVLTDSNSNGFRSLHSAVSADHLSLRNWGYSVESESNESKQSSESASDTSKSSVSSDPLSLSKWKAPVEEPKKSPAIDTQDLDFLIPPFIRTFCNPKPMAAELRVTYDAPTSQCTYTYSILCVEDDNAKNNCEEVKSLQKPELKKMVSTSAFAVTPSPVSALCDGPCKKEFPSNLLNTIGRCGHYLCTACYGIVKNNDGTNGCSSLSCFWKGSSREESKKNYERDICRKQRAKATDMNARGIDVKPASAASSGIDTSSYRPTFSRTHSETNMSSYSPSESLCIIPSVRKPPKFDSKVCTRLVIVEPHSTYGMTHVYCNSRLLPSTNLLTALKTMLNRKLKPTTDYILSGHLYYGLINEAGVLGMRKIKVSKYGDLTVADIPKMQVLNGKKRFFNELFFRNNRLVLIMDLGYYVEKGVKIYME